MLTQSRVDDKYSIRLGCSIPPDSNMNVTLSNTAAKTEYGDATQGIIKRRSIGTEHKTETQSS